MAAFNILAIDKATPKGRVPPTGTGYNAPVTLNAATGNEVAFTLEYTVNKATSGNDTGLVINQVDTASPGTSLLLDLQVGGSSKMSIGNSGYINFANAGTASIENYSTHRLSFVAGGSYRLELATGNLSIPSGNSFAWSSSSGTPGQTLDLFLYRDAANTLAQRNGTNAQTFRVYNTYTDASNYERGFMRWSSNVLEIGTEAAGTGTQRVMKAIFGDSNTWIQGVNSGDWGLLFGTGGAPTGAKAQLFSSNNIGVFALGAQGVFGLSSNNTVNSAAPDIVLGRSAANIFKVYTSTAKSAVGAIEAKLRTDTAYTAGVVTDTGYLVLYDNTGTAYKVPAVAV